LHKLREVLLELIDDITHEIENKHWQSKLSMYNSYINSTTERKKNHEKLIRNW
jgi:uncharacterized membrane protein